MSLRSVADLENEGPVHIEQIDVYRVAVPMHEPFRISSGEVSSKEATLVRLSNHKAFGWGESSAMPGAFYSSDTPDSCHEQVLRVAPALCGSSWETMSAFERHLRSLSLSPFVRVAFETAAWELLARSRELSLRALFGLASTPVESGLAIGLYPTVSELLAAIKRYGVHRYKRLKIKIKRGHDIELVQAVRTLYPTLPLFVDANGDYGPGDLDHLKHLDRFGLMMIEQPFPREHVHLSSELQHAIETPVCFDEGIETADEVYGASAMDACRIVNIKLQRVGGYLEALRVGEACLSTGIPLWMGTMPELGVGSAQALVLASHPANRFPTDVEESTRWFVDDILMPELTLQAGSFILPTAPGLGYAVDEAKLRKFSTGSWSFTR